MEHSLGDTARAGQSQQVTLAGIVGGTLTWGHCKGGAGQSQQVTLAGIVGGTLTWGHCKGGAGQGQQVTHW